MSVNEALILMKKVDLIEKKWINIAIYKQNINISEIKLKNEFFIISMTLPIYVVLIINI